jgi:uncharacterized protein YbjT (DUF2867 family)
MDLVVGATGRLGGHIAHRLLKMGEPVRALVREGADYSQLQAAGVEGALGDLKNPSSLARALIGVDRVIATATAAQRSGKDTVESVDRNGYENLIAAARTAGIDQFIFVSAHGFAADSPVALARAKVATEQTLIASGLNYTILRPSLFMESWIGTVLGAQLQSGPNIVIIGDADKPYPFVCAHNVADLAIAVRSNPAAERLSIPISAQAVSFGELVDWISALTGRAISLESVPPGSQVPGVPPLVLELWSMLASGNVEPIETVEVAVRFGLSLETARAYVSRAFAKPSPLT